MDDGGGNGGCTFKVKHGSDAAEIAYVHMKQERERLEMWLENERRGSKVGLTPRLRTGESEIKVVEEELLHNRIEESGIFLIRAGRPIMINSVLERLRPTTSYI